ncbi:putative RNA-directed DNA polymerase, eukaryota, reverse transcriptase zinc-binding domain protein [Tanacetum coccineum]
MVNEIITWAKKHRKRLMFLKVDFEKAFDSLSWSLLFSIMEQVGFSRKWINWIHSCLDSAFASVLVNGSPTKEFKLERGLQQGDLLSPFLFILSIEALNVAFLEATNNNIFHGVQVGKDKTFISHLQYADDALILGEWSLLNAKNLHCNPTCFHLAFGLKVNFNKSKLFGVGVSNIELNVIASSLGCLASQFPCSYLGLPIGRLTLIKSVFGSLGVYYFSIFKSPKKIIQKLESIRRRFFWGGNSEDEKISWIAWKKVISTRKYGGLGIGSLMESNQSLLAKWWWRFRIEENALWGRVVRSIHGSSGGILNDSICKQSSGTWSQISKLKGDLNNVGINLPMLFKKKLGNGMNTSF